MPFQKGMKKPEGSGRKLGTRNKRKLARAAEVFAEAGFHPLKRAIDLILLGQLEVKDEVKACLELYSWCEAKPKSEAIQDDDDDPALEEVSTEDLLRIVKSNGVT